MKAFREWWKQCQFEERGYGKAAYLAARDCHKETLKWILANHRRTIWNEHDMDFVREELEDEE